MPPTKLSQLTAFMRAGEWGKALSLAAKFGDLGPQREAITRGHNAGVNPGFYRQLKRCPEKEIEAGIEALKARYPYYKETK